MTFDEFVHYVDRLQSESCGAAPPPDAVYKKMFDMVDEDHSGEISVAEFALTLRKLGQNMSSDDVMEVTKDVDNDGSGTIGLVEFKQLMRSLNI